jgi:hypothetical protein
MTRLPVISARLEKVVVGFNGAGGLHLLNADGKELWKQDDGNVWHVEIAAVDEKSSKMIVHSNARGQLTLRDASGKIMARYTLKSIWLPFTCRLARRSPSKQVDRGG